MTALPRPSTSTSCVNTPGFARRCPEHQGVLTPSIGEPGTPMSLVLLAAARLCFDTASVAEIEMCSRPAPRPDRISFGKTHPEGARHRGRAYALGVGAAVRRRPATPSWRRSPVPPPSRACSLPHPPPTASGRMARCRGKFGCEPAPPPRRPTCLDARPPASRPRGLMPSRSTVGLLLSRNPQCLGSGLLASAAAVFASAATRADAEHCQSRAALPTKYLKTCRRETPTALAISARCGRHFGTAYPGEPSSSRSQPRHGRHDRASSRL